MESERIGILGGSFDPLHQGHLEIAARAAELFGLAYVIFLLAANPPHKMQRRMLSAGRRLEILERGVAGHDQFRCSSLELELPGPSFTYRTHQVLRERMPGARFFFLIGGDSFLQIRTWKNYRELLAGLDFLVYIRAASEKKKIQRIVAETGVAIFEEGDPVGNGIGVRLFSYSGKYSGISSSIIRRLLKEGRSVSGYLPPAIVEIVKKEYGE